MAKQPPPAPTASAIGPCPAIVQIVGRPGIEHLPTNVDGTVNIRSHTGYPRQPARLTTTNSV